jgi:hypothetical protein
MSPHAMARMLVILGVLASTFALGACQPTAHRTIAYQPFEPAYDEQCNGGRQGYGYRDTRYQSRSERRALRRNMYMLGIPPRVWVPLVSACANCLCDIVKLVVEHQMYDGARNNRNHRRYLRRVERYSRW